MKLKTLSVLLFLFLALPASAQERGRYNYNNIKNAYPSYYCPVSADSESVEKVQCILEKTLTLDTALEMALRNNPDVQVAEARIRQSEVLLTRANAAFMPVVNVYTEYTRGDFPSGYLFKTIDQRKFVNSTDFNDPGIVKNFETGINVQLNIFDGGRHVLNRRMAGEDLAISTADRLAVRNSISSQLISAWYDTMSAEEYVKISEESVKTVKNQLDIMTIRYEGGSALRSDILSLNVRLAQAEEELLKSHNRLKLAGAALSTVLGFPPDREVSIDPSPVELKCIPETYEKGLETAIAKRPELSKIRSVVKKSRIGMDMARSSWLPTANLVGKYYLDDPSMEYNLNRDNWAVGVMVNWNIFSGFADKASADSSDASLREALSSDRKAFLGISLDVKNAYLRKEESTARMDVAKRSVSMAEENFELVRKQYDGGSVTITRYLESELDLNAAKIRVASAYYDHEKATADIARSIGLLSEPEQMLLKSEQTERSDRVQKTKEEKKNEK